VPLETPDKVDAKESRQDEERQAEVDNEQSQESPYAEDRHEPNPRQGEGTRSTGSEARLHRGSGLERGSFPARPC